VIESVFEKVDVKRKVFSEIEKVCSKETIIATNTSMISLDELAVEMKNPGRFIGMHFFNPAHHMPLVEVIRRKETEPAVVAGTLAFAKRINKTPVLVQNQVGFIVSRIFVPYLKEAFRLVEEGALPHVVDLTMAGFGFPMGPLRLIDMAGLDILVFTDRELRRAFPDQEPLSQIVTRLVDAGLLGQKTGSGMYTYMKDDRSPRHHDTAMELITQVRQDTGIKPREIGSDEILERLLLRMVNEAFHVLEERIAEHDSDIDVASVMGLGFPDFHGGVLRYARELGLKRVAKMLELLEARHGARYKPCGLLQKTKGD
jgi:3-hydroxyacyl-CoA dehydrogenase